MQITPDCSSPTATAGGTTATPKGRLLRWYGLSCVASSARDLRDRMGRGMEWCIRNCNNVARIAAGMHKRGA